jgi:hypothetical protein
MKSNTGEGKARNPDSVCDLCGQNYSCGVLKTAIEILDKESGSAPDTYSRELFKNFKLKLARFGYHYPASDTMCWLNDKRPVVNDLVREAMGLIEEVRSRYTA